MCTGNLIYAYFRPNHVIIPTLYQTWTAVLKSPACVLSLFPFQIKICDFPYPISELNCCPQECSTCPGNLIPISDQNMWFSLPYIRTELLSSRVQHVSWKPYSHFRSKYVIFPTLYQNWTAVLESPACVLGTLFLFQIKISDFPYPIIIRRELLTLRVQHVSWEPCPISDQDMWFFLPYVVYQNWTAVLESPARVLGTLFLFQIKICDFPYPILDMNCWPWESSMCPGNLVLFQIKICDFPYPTLYIRTEPLSSRVQHVSDEPYPYFWSKYVIFPTLYSNSTAVLKSPACVVGTLSLFLIKN